MTITIREAVDTDLDHLKDLTEHAFEPIFASFAQILGADIFARAYPDWRTLQRNLVQSMFDDEKINVWVADVEGEAVGLITYTLNQEENSGEIQFLVVHPDYQNDGVGTQLNDFVLDKMRSAGMQLAIVGTGGDDAHAPARRAYEKSGFVALPSVWYFKKLD